MTTDQKNLVYEKLKYLGLIARSNEEEIEAWEEFCLLLMNIVEREDNDNTE